MTTIEDMRSAIDNGGVNIWYMANQRKKLRMAIRFFAGHYTEAPVEEMNELGWRSTGDATMESLQRFSAEYIANVLEYLMTKLETTEELMAVDRTARNLPEDKRDDLVHSEWLRVISALRVRGWYFDKSADCWKRESEESK